MRRPGLVVVAATVSLGFAGFCVLVTSIAVGVERITESAQQRYHKGRSDGLMALADCSDCPMKERNRAVWALGRLQEQRAVPLLRAHLTGRRCDHERALCQHEIRKSLDLIEAQGTLHARFWAWAESRIPGR